MRDEQLQGGCRQLYCIRAGTDTGAAAATAGGGGGGTIQPSLHRTKTRVKLTTPHILVLGSRTPFQPPSDDKK